LFYRERARKDQAQLSKSKPNGTEFQAQTSTMLPNLIRLTRSKINKSKRRPENSATQPRQIVQTCRKQRLQRSKKSSSKVATKPSLWNSRKPIKNEAKIAMQSTTQR